VPKVFIGNIPYGVSERELRDWVDSLGFQTLSAQIIRDRSTGNSRGFGFVEFKEEHQLQHAIVALNGRRMQGRILTVSLAVPFTRSEPTAA
jgi:cold-inducible RNA-binding protein